MKTRTYNKPILKATKTTDVNDTSAKEQTIKSYFILDEDGTLTYFNEKKDFSSGKKIDLTGDVKVKTSLEKEGTDKYVLEIETKDRTYKLSTDSESERDS